MVVVGYVDYASRRRTPWRPIIGIETGTTTGTQTWPYSTRIVTIRYTVNGTNDKVPHAEEPRDRETITRGFVVAVGQATAPLTDSEPVQWASSQAAAPLAAYPPRRWAALIAL